MSLEIFNHYRTGIPDIDNHHWDIINRLNAAVTTSESNRKLANTMVKEALSDLTADLKEEEKIMSGHFYPYAHAHAQSHKELLKSLQEAVDQMEAGFRYMSPTYIIGRWKRTFLEHIDQHDMQLAAFIQRQK
jgi:hemerythrin-like metal-binding protein